MKFSKSSAPCMAKECTLCHEVKELTEFYTDARTLDGHVTRCKPCHKGVYHSWKRSNSQKIRGYNKTWYETSGIRFTRHGLTQESYNELLKIQNGVCAICKNAETLIVREKERPLHIDHDHKTGVIRGLLCSACNTGIGKFNDSLERLQAAIDYLTPKQS